MRHFGMLWSIAFQGCSLSVMGLVVHLVSFVSSPRRNSILPHMPVLTNPVTLSSISLSDSPSRDKWASRNDSCIEITYLPMIHSSPVHILYKLYQHVLMELCSLCLQIYEPYRAKTRGCVPAASLNMIGVCGLFFFIVGYARERKDLLRGTVSNWSSSFT